MDDYIDCPHCAAASPTEEFHADGGRCPVCGKANYELDGYMDGYRQGARLAGGKMPDGSDMPDEAESARYVLDFMHRKGVESLNVDDENRHPSYQRDFDDEEELDDAVAWVPKELIHNPQGNGPRAPWNPVIRRQDIEDWFARNPKHRKIPPGQYGLPPEADPGTNRSLLSNRQAKNDEAGRGMGNNTRTAAIDFLAGQNTSDREELLFRAHRHASNQTGQMPVPVAQRVVQEFVAAVNREIASTPKPRRQATQRTAATVPDFPDELMF